MRTACLIAAVCLIAGCAAPSNPPPATDQAAVPKIDVHAHYIFDRDYLTPLLDAWNMRAMLVEVIHVDDLPARRWPAMLAHRDVHPEHLLLCVSFDASRIEAPGFAEQTIAGLKEARAQGAIMVKVWKEIGMVIKDEQGRYIQIDDARFQPIWDFLAAESIPVLAHIGEPRAAWLPLDEDSPHYQYYRDHPQYHAYLHPEIPRWETIMQARDHWLAENPDLTVIGAHLGSMAYDVDEVARRLDRYPNFYVETAARFGDLAKQPRDRVRDFFIRYQDRILYGTDLGTDEPADDVSEAERRRERNHIEQRFSLHWQYLTSADSLDFATYGTSYSARTQGLGLPLDVVEKIYYRNAGHTVLRRPVRRLEEH